MTAFLLTIAAIWGLGTLFFCVALALAARRPIPPPTESPEPPDAVPDAQDNLATAAKAKVGDRDGLPPSSNVFALRR